ncbi:heavy metal-associated domain-containing protein [Luteibacter sp. dw_328]|uniref:heavy-metal-associated domain-containing protein n=1 Tax=Luteibacter sp. dw_328 TaxID=2719796 RepID=UPI0023EE9B53|nr:heavy metal-associated domain-containing protein [Luteibacter sp. dw_328]
MITFPVELAIDGMTCNSCARHVATALDGVPHVEKVEVDLARKRALVHALAGIHVTALVTAVEDAGYSARCITDGAAREVGHE